MKTRLRAVRACLRSRKPKEKNDRIYRHSSYFCNNLFTLSSARSGCALCARFVYWIGERARECVMPFVLLSSDMDGGGLPKQNTRHITDGQIAVVSIILDLAVLLKSTNQKGHLKISGKQWEMYVVSASECAIDNK